MKKKRFTDAQRAMILSEQGSGKSLEEICRTHQISPATFYHWKQEVAIHNDEDKRRLKALELENARLKKMYMNLKIDYDILTEGYSMAKPAHKEELIDSFADRQSVRHTSVVLGIRRQTYYARKRNKKNKKNKISQSNEEIDKTIVSYLQEAIKEPVSWGFWMIFYFLRRQVDFKWNHKKVYRIWRLNGFHLIKKPKRPVIKRLYQALLSPSQVNQGWAMDFLSDWIINDGQSIRIINIMDECSRMALWTQAKVSITAKMLVDILDQLVQVRGKPAYIRCDNGPEFIAEVLGDWAKDKGIKLKHIQPGKPTQNGLIERLNGTLRTECLNLEWFKSLQQVNDGLQDWWQVYNFHRPHSSIGYLTPDEFEQLNKNRYFYPVAA